MEIVFLLSHIPDPRTNKRIAMAKQIGNVSVICTRRVSQDIWEPYDTDVHHEIIPVDLPPASRPVKRFFSSHTYRHHAMQLLRTYQPSLIYTEGLDSLSIAVAYQKTKKECRIFYEVADLREIYLCPPKQLRGKLIRALIRYSENRLIGHVDQLIVTSEKFYELYYHQYFPREKVLFIPNMPEQLFFRDYQKKEGGPFTVGFIGGIRYLGQMKMLVDAAGECGCNVLFAGAGGTSADYLEIQSYCQGMPHVSFTGKYNYQRDIALLYGRVNCVYAVYDADNPNVRIALPNKLYESIYCELPIIVAKGTYLAELVEQWGVGVAVSHTETNELVETLTRMMTESAYYSDLVNGCALQRYRIDTGSYDQDLRDRVRENHSQAAL